jgi:hypothetical protein
MRRLGLCALLSLIVTMPLGAQQMPPSRFAPTEPVAMDSVPAVGRKPLPPGFVTQQAFAGFAGFTIGGLAGGLAGSALVRDNNNGWNDLAAVVFGMAIGGAVGSSITVYRFSNGKGYQSSYAATLVGSVAGFFGGPLFWVTVPMGSTIGYNLARK